MNSGLMGLKVQLVDLWALAAVHSADTSAIAESVRILIAQAFESTSDCEASRMSLLDAEDLVDKGQTRLALFHIKEAFDAYDRARHLFTRDGGRPTSEAW